MIYRVNFKLSDPVDNLEEAKDFLNDDMTPLLKNDIPELNSVISIFWKLESENIGYIELVAEDIILPEYLNSIYDWIKGQNYDGLGESFEENFFSCIELSDDCLIKI